MRVVNRGPHTLCRDKLLPHKKVRTGANFPSLQCSPVHGVVSSLFYFIFVRVANLDIAAKPNYFDDGRPEM